MAKYNSVIEALEAMSSNIGIELRGEIEFCPHTGRHWIPDPDDCLTPWTVLSCIEYGITVRKDWIDGQEIMVLEVQNV